VPVDALGRELGPVQLPSTLPTLDELIGLDGWDGGNVHRALIDAADAGAPIQVYTLHAELEGQRLLDTARQALQAWRAQGHELGSLGQLVAALDRSVLPRCVATTGSVPGRSGELAVQGDRVGG